MNLCVWSAGGGPRGDVDGNDRMGKTEDQKSKGRDRFRIGLLSKTFVSIPNPVVPLDRRPSFTNLHSFIVMKLAVLLSLAASAVALSVGSHAARGAGHNGLAARLDNGTLGRRATLNKRQCRTRTNTVAPSSTSTSETPTSTPEPTSTSTYVEPTTSSSEDQWWTWIQPTSSTEEAQPTTTQASSGGGDSSSPISYYFAGTNSGQITYYATGLGACGWQSTDSDYIAAMSFDLFYGWPGSEGKSNGNEACGHTLNISRGSKTITVTVVDSCEACAPADVDLSPSAFQALADLSEGRVPITWTWAS